MPDLAPYTLSTFRRVALRRREESRLLVRDHTLAKQRGGAIVCALLAVECALKALLLHDQKTDLAVNLSDDLKKAHFSGAGGHALGPIYGSLSPGRRGRCDATAHKAISDLHVLDRYLYRYGGQGSGIQNPAATDIVNKAAAVVGWMEQEI